jgi:hypothetical protein
MARLCSVRGIQHVEVYKPFFRFMIWLPSTSFFLFLSKEANYRHYDSSSLSSLKHEDEYFMACFYSSKF